jgi:hypothetical protein
VVFSLGPSLWTHGHTARWQKDEADTVVIDLSELLAVDGTMQLPEMNIQAKVLEELTGAGWPRRSLVSQYRSDLKSRLITDVAVFDDDGTLRMALEVKLPTGRPIDENFVRVNAGRESAAQWFCLTDGRQYHLLNRRSGSYQVLEEAPSPESLEVPIVGEYLSAGPGHHPPTITKRPSTPEEFVSLVADLEPQAVTIDPSVVVMRRSMGHPNTTVFWSVVEMSGEMLSDDSYAQIEGMSRRLDIYRLLLVWAASLSSIKTLSTVDDPHFTTSPGERHLRRYVSDRLRLCGVLEMPPGLYSGLTSYAFSLLYFGGNRDTVYFDVLTSRGDLARYETRQWFASISAWMDGKEHSTGYTTRLDGGSPWTFSANSPEVSESIERLGRLSELSTIGELCHISRTGGPYKGREFANTSMGHNPRLEPDDIVLPETVGQRSARAARVGEATRSRERHLVLRPVDERVSVDFLVEYLNSPTARQLISATAVGRFGGAYKRISTEQLRNLPVPIVDDASAESFDRVRRVEARLRSKVEEMESLRISLFEARGVQDFKTRLTNLARVGEMMSASMEQVERAIPDLQLLPLPHRVRLPPAR